MDYIMLDYTNRGQMNRSFKQLFYEHEYLR